LEEVSRNLSQNLSHDEIQPQKTPTGGNGRFIITGKSPSQSREASPHHTRHNRDTVESGFSSPIQSDQNTPLKNNSNILVSPGRFASPSGLRMAGSPTNLDYGIPNQKTDPLQARPPRARGKSATKAEPVLGQASLSSPLRQTDLFPRSADALNTSNHAINVHDNLNLSQPVFEVQGSNIANAILEAESEDVKRSAVVVVSQQKENEETPLVTLNNEITSPFANSGISSFPGPLNPNGNNLLTVPLQAYQEDSTNPNELDPTPTFTSTLQDRPNRFSRDSPELQERTSESPVPRPQNILRQEYELKTPESKGMDELNSSSSMIYKTPENEVRRITDNYEEIDDENFFTPVDSHRKKYMYPNTPLAKIEEGDEEGSMLNTASKLQQDMAGHSLVYSSPFSTRRSPIRSPGRFTTRQTILSTNNYKNSGKKYYNAPETLKADIRNPEDALEPIGIGAKKMAKTTPKKFDNRYLTTSPNKQAYMRSPH